MGRIVLRLRCDLEAFATHHTAWRRGLLWVRWIKQSAEAAISAGREHVLLRIRCRTNATRSDSVLRRLNWDLVTHERLTAPDKLVAPQPFGPLKEMRFRYIQGMHFWRERGALLVADANLGSIFQISAAEHTYKVIAGQPIVADSRFVGKAGAQRNEWLGPIRAVTSDGSQTIYWMNGNDSTISRLNLETSEITKLPDVGGGRPCFGSGMITI